MKKILIIENRERITNRIEAILPDQDFKLFLSHDREDGYKIAARYLPDLILFCCCDGDDDLEFVKKICTNEALSLIPLIVITGDFSVEKQRAAMDLGADDCIPEAFIERSLFNSVNKRFLKLSRIKQTVQNAINAFDEYNDVKGSNDHVLVKIGSKLKLIEFSEIVCITALKEYSKIITRENFKIIVRKSLKAWLKMLPAKSFLRIHRATIINIDYIKEIKRTNERTYTVHLKYIKETFDFSYRYANILRHTFPT